MLTTGQALDTLYRTSVRHITPNAKTYVASLYERAREVELPATYDGEDVVVNIGRDGANARLSSRDGGVSIEVESRTEQGATLDALVSNRPRDGQFSGA